MSEPALIRLHDAAANRGIDLSAYRPEFLLRRLRRRALDAGDIFVDAEVDRILARPHALDGFLAELSIGVTGFFRDALPFGLLEAKVVPELARLPQVFGWSAGCAAGQELYSLAMLLDERSAQFRLVGSDQNAALIARARVGDFTDEELGNVTLARLRRHFSPVAKGWRVVHALRSRAQFVEDDLVSGALPGSFGQGELHLVLCRNVLIYLAPAARRLLLAQICDALAVGGYLLLGASEDVELPEQLVAIDQEARLFRRERR